jgi:exoribonuclease-2
MTTVKVDLRAMAHKALIEAGFTPDFEPAALSQLSKIARKTSTTADTKDLRNLLWSSIDNNESMDLDQIEYAEKLSDGNTRILVGIADVDAFVPKARLSICMLPTTQRQFIREW